ncbi:MAG: ABC transporter permease [Nitrosopumilus sp.]|nr:ABC transporter permease [Nitrosopumilus sp.]
MSEIKTPSHLSQTGTVTRYEFLKIFKGKKLYGMIAFAFVVPIILVALPDLLGGEYPDLANDFVASQMNFMVIVIVISASFFGSSSIVSEFHDRTAYSLLPNPVNRESIWFGKFLAALTISFMISSIFYMVIAFGTGIEYEEVPVEIISSWGLSFVVVLMITSISFLFSSILKGPTGATVAIFILFILIFPMVEGIIITFDESKPWWLPSFLAKVTEFSMFTPYPSDLEPDELPRGPFDHHRFVAYVDESVSIMVGYTIAAGIGSIFIFKKKEMA